MEQLMIRKYQEFQKLQSINKSLFSQKEEEVIHQEVLLAGKKD